MAKTRHHFAQQPKSLAGYSPASLHGNFVCTGRLEADARLVFSFDFYDAKRQIKQYPELAAGAVGTFFGRLIDGQPYTLAQRAATGPKECAFAYFDKYGRKQSLLDLTDDDDKMLRGMLL
jgi:hypothetical protein